MYESVFVVVLYNKTIDQSKTVDRILLHGLNDKSLYIAWNNGPKKIKPVNVSVENKYALGQFVLHQTVDNISLAKIYNSVIESYSAKRYIFLDQDSNLSSEYIEAVNTITTAEVGVPIIYVSGEIINPRIDNEPFSKGKIIKENTFVTSIGSGLVVGRDIADKMFQHFGNIFDERFYLYGVDTTFFHRLKKLKFSKQITVISGFEHGLSRLETSFDPIYEFRRKERSNDVALQLRFYATKKKCILQLIKFTLNYVKNSILNQKQQYHLITILKVIITGKHERS